MVSGREKPEEAIFKAAVQLQDPARRQAYVFQACAGDRRLLADVETLLQYHDASSFLDAPVLGPQARLLDEPAVTEGPGTVIGRYKLLEKIGEGGMAVVYMAEQTEPIRRKVALKIIKLGMDTCQVIARFEAERQALALMDHPNIAKVLDASATETGRPYFVMELVQGVSITEYCDRNSLSTKDRLALFLQVCDAVQHAHQKGIIHRDIKPSNVMVTHHDGQPIPKVIDFGIAKATNQRLTEKTLFTRYAHLIGTPAYMSPEQAELSAAEVDFRTDVYSLAVLLYELLTGTTPFGQQRLHQVGYFQMQQIICTEEPTKPSSKIQTSDAAMASVAARRGTTPSTLRKLLRRDLDWIVIRGLEKNRDRRYATAGDLAADIQRHLNHEPVDAAAPSVSYRLSKFARRHHLAMAMVALVTGATLMGATVAKLAVWRAGSLAGKVEHAAGMGQRHVWDVPPMSALLGGISSDGRYLSYVDWTAGNLAVCDLTTQVSWLVTRNTDPTWKTSDGSNECSIIAPDGKQIAYSWRNHTNPEFYDLRIVDLDGANMRVLYREPNAVFYLAPHDFSPGGREVLACFCGAEQSLVDERTGRRLSSGSLVLVSVADGSVRILKTWQRCGVPNRARFSPDGRYIAYGFDHEDDLTRQDIFLMDLDGGSEITLIEHPANDQLCGWTPDGRRVIFASDRSSKRDLWMIEVAGGLPQGEPRKLMGSFDGWPIGFTTDGSFYYGIGTQASNVYVAQLDSTGLTLLGEPEIASSQFVGSTTMGDWSPDGRFLAYRVGAGRLAGRSITVCSVETSQEQRVAPEDLFRPNSRMVGPRWSPDGRSLLLCGEGQEGGRGLYTVNVETGVAALIATTRDGLLRLAVWSPDSTSIYTRSPRSINRLDLATGKETELYRVEGGITRGLDVSPDGRWLTFCRGDDSLVVMPSAGGEPREVGHLDEDEVNTGLGHVFVRWTPDGGYLLFPKRQKELWQVNINTGEQRQIGAVPGDLVDATVHPDGRQIALTVQQGGSALWVMENFLPD
jgi:serine/threonine protein kinase/Tol biopolymer transport system component